MKYYKNTNGEVFAYESEEERQEWGAPELVEMTPEEIDAHLNPPPPPPVVPKQVSRAQGKAALIAAGFYEPVQSYIDSLEGIEKEIAIIAFNETNTWRRNSPFLTQVASALSLTEEDLDNLFISAEQFQF